MRPDPERARLAGYLPQEKRIAWGLSALDIAALGQIAAPLAEARSRALEALRQAHARGACLCVGVGNGHQITFFENRSCMLSAPISLPAASTTSI